jgi:hypothetical protein
VAAKQQHVVLLLLFRKPLLLQLHVPCQQRESASACKEQQSIGNVRVATIYLDSGASRGSMHLLLCSTSLYMHTSAQAGC